MQSKFPLVLASMLVLQSCSGPSVFLNEGEQNQLLRKYSYGHIEEIKSNTTVKVYASEGYVRDAILDFAHAKGYKTNVIPGLSEDYITYVSDAKHEITIRHSSAINYVELIFPEDMKRDALLRTEVLTALKAAAQKNTNPHQHLNAMATVPSSSKEAALSEIDAFFKKLYGEQKVWISETTWQGKSYHLIQILREDHGTLRAYDRVYVHVLQKQKERVEIHLTLGVMNQTAKEYNITISSKEEAQNLLNSLVNKLF